MTEGGCVVNLTDIRRRLRARRARARLLADCGVHADRTTLFASHVARAKWCIPRCAVLCAALAILLVASGGDAATRTSRHRTKQKSGKSAPSSTRRSQSASKKSSTSQQPSHAPVLAGKPLPVTSIPPPPGKEVTPEDIADQQAQLDKIREEARRNRAAAAQLRGREKSVQKDLRRIEQDLATTERYLRQLAVRAQIVSGQRAVTERNLADAIARREDQRGTLAWRLREVYKFGRDRRFEVLFSSRSFPELLERTDFFARILEADRALLTSINVETVRISDHRRALLAVEHQLAQITSEQQLETRRLASLRAERETTIAKLRTQRKGYEETAAQMEASARRIQSIIAALERRRRAQEEAARRAREAGKPPAPEDTWLLNADFAKNKGNLPWPVRGEIVTPYGRSVNPRFNTVTINNGIDIAVPLGTNIQSVAKGRVELVETLPGYGKTIILNHGNGYYTIYAHCASLSVQEGAQVEARQVIATVGDTDSVKGPVLHFEIRQGKQAVNPTGWLR
jgi:septal ring factor EnvC (AmiA/AmiB activator)